MALVVACIVFMKFTCYRCFRVGENGKREEMGSLLTRGAVALGALGRLALWPSGHAVAGGSCEGNLKTACSRNTPYSSLKRQ